MLFIRNYLTVLMLFLSLATFSRSFCVNSNLTTGANDGHFWTTAFFSLQLAIDASQNGDTIKVAGGTYTPPGSSITNSSFVLKSGIIILGGYSPSTGDTTDKKKKLGKLSCNTQRYFIKRGHSRNTCKSYWLIESCDNGRYFYKRLALLWHYDIEYE